MRAGEDRGIYSVAMFHVVAKFALRPRFFIPMAKKTHPPAPLLLLSKSQPLMLGCDLVLGASLEAAASILLQYFTSEQSLLCSGVFMPATKSVSADALTCSSCQSQFLSLNIIVIFAFSYQAYSFITQQLFYYYLIRAKSNIFPVFYVIYSPFTSRMDTCYNIIAASFFDHNSKKSQNITIIRNVAKS